MFWTPAEGKRGPCFLQLGIISDYNVWAEEALLIVLQEGAQ